MKEVEDHSHAGMIAQRQKVQRLIERRQKRPAFNRVTVHGLQGACTIQTYKILQELVEDKSQPPELLVAARKAMYVTKKALFADHEGEG